MAEIVVFDADVLIGYLSRDDAHHDEATERVRLALAAGTRRLLSAVNYTELLIGSFRSAGPGGADTVDQMLNRFSIETIHVDMDMARRAATVRARTNLRIPDAFAVATAIHAEKRGHGDVRIESFDEDVRKAFADLYPESV